MLEQIALYLGNAIYDTGVVTPFYHTGAVNKSFLRHRVTFAANAPDRPETAMVVLA